MVLSSLRHQFPKVTRTIAISFVRAFSRVDHQLPREIVRRPGSSSLVVVARHRWPMETRIAVEPSFGVVVETHRPTRD